MSSESKSISVAEAEHIVSQCVKQPNFEVINIKESAVDNSTGGFMSDYLRFQIQIRLPNGVEKVYEFFSKTVPRSSGMHKDFVLEVECYKKETGFYNTILPLLQKYDKKTKDSEKRSKGRWAPYCFYTRDDIIVMEDLRAAGFKILSGRDMLNWNYCVCVLKTLASFHAASIIFEEKEKMKNPQSQNMLQLHPEFFTNVLNRSMPAQETRGWFATGKKALVALVPYLPKYQNNPTLQETIQEKLPGVCDETKKFTTSDVFRNVVCHGDLWCSNFMFRFGSNGRPETCRFVDFQLLRYAPPATDLVVFLYTTTNRKFRARHWDALIGVYLDELAAELQSGGLLLEALLSREELRRSMEAFSAGGRAVAALYFQLINMDEEMRSQLFTSAERFSNFFMVDRSKDVRDFFLKDEFYRFRLEEIMDEIVELDIINSADNAQSK